MKTDRPSGVQTASTLKISELGDATCDDVQCYIDSVMSSGIRSGFELTNSRVASELDVELGTGFIKITDSCVALTKSFDFAGVDNVTLTDNKTNYIYVDYNGGTPQILATTSRATIERYRQFTLGLVSKEGSTLRIGKGGVRTCDIARILHELFIERDGFSHISGATTTETGALNLYVTAGVWYRGLNRFTTPIFDTSVADTFEYTHYGAASWITDNATATAIDATHYNDGTDVLGSLTVNAYGTQWVYVTAADDLFVIYGTENGTLSDAQDASPPTSLPEYISTMGELIAKIIVRQTGVIISIEATYDVKFTSSGVPNHNDLGLLNSGDYQHLTAAQLAALVLNKWDATVAPTVNEDSGDGYGVGSVWADVTADKVYTCLDATLTAAVWLETGFGSLLKHPARKSKPKVACIGSSYTQQNTVQSSGTTLYKESRSWTDWWNILTGNSLNMDVYLDASDPLSRGFSGANFGVSSEDSTDILARIPDVIAAKPDVCLVQSGSNNVNAPTTVIADVKASMLLLYNAGIIGVYMGISFRGSASWDAENMQQASYINATIARWLADNGYGIYIDTNKYLCDFDTALGTPYAGALYTDSIHYVTWSGFQIGRILHENITPLLSFNPAEVTGNADAYDATNNPYGNVWPNPLISINANIASAQGYVGTGVTAGTGSQATSVGRSMMVERNSGTSTGVANVETRGAGKGNWQTLVATPVGSATSLFLLRSNGSDMTHGLAAGTWVRIGCDVDISTFGTDPLNSGFQNIGLYVDLRSSSASVGRIITMHQYSSIPLPNIAWTGRIESPPFQVPATCDRFRTRLEVKVDDTADGTGTIKLGSIYIRPCDDPTVNW